MSEALGHIDFTKYHAQPQHTLGEVFADVDGKAYKYIRFNNGPSNIAAAANALCYFVGTDGTTVTSENAFGNGRNAVAGVFMSAIADLHFGWIQTWGMVPELKTDGGDLITKGDFVIASTGNGTCTRMTVGTAPTHRVVGIAQADDVDAADTVATYLLLER